MDSRKKASDARKSTITAASKTVRDAPRSVRRAAAGGKRPRRSDYSSSTRTALIKSARELFTEHGYAGTSLDEVVAQARVTKGALYHHYGSKLALFESVFLAVQDEANKKIDKAMRKTKSPIERANTGLRLFLEVCREPTYRRIVMQEAPVALGHEYWQEAEKVASFGLVERIVNDLLPDLGADGDLAEAFTHVFYGAIRASGEWVADSEDPESAADQVQAVIASVLAGLRSLETIAAIEAPSGADTDPQ